MLYYNTLNTRDTKLPKMNSDARVFAGAVAGLCAMLLAATARAAPVVVVTVGPVHSLVAGVMAGIGAPRLLLPAGATPHLYSLRPSAARMLASADLVIRVGPALEAFLDRPLARLARRARVVTLMKDAGLVLRRTAGNADPHVWLDPENARRIVRHTARVLGEIDPGAADRYAANAREMAARIDRLDSEIAGLLAPVRRVPFVVFHDAYGYLENRYGLNRIAAVSLAADRAPGARRLRDIRAAIRDGRARCVFAEPQFRPALIEALTRGTAAHTGILDPLGADIPPGPDSWFTLMRRLANALRHCLLP